MDGGEGWGAWLGAGRTLSKVSFLGGDKNPTLPGRCGVLEIQKVERGLGSLLVFHFLFSGEAFCFERFDKVSDLNG